MIDFCIDAHVATSVFAEHWDSTLPSPNEVREQLMLRVESGQLRYVCTDALLRELAPLSVSDPRLYELTRQYWLRLCDGWFLLTGAELFQFEVRHRRALEGAERFAPRTDMLETLLRSTDPAVLGP